MQWSVVALNPGGGSRAALVAGDAISEPNQAAEETEAVEEVIEVGEVEKNEGSNSEAEELLVARTRAGRAVKRPREY
ncbi:Benzoate 4-monooxygenase [Fusarium oxysporum f. sp. albedinis]|nr:Benzoate 4-monooxygenase [Fusarium oxysporum f. sp. albedinis]